MGEIPIEKFPRGPENFPKVTYSPEILRPETPYQVHVDTLLLAEFLSDHGVPEDHIRKLKINIKDKNWIKLGQYNPLTKTVDLYVGNVWNEYQKSLKKIDNLTSGTKSPGDNDFGDALTTKRLSKYLKTAPPERGKAFAEKLLHEARARKINNNVLHELQHAIDMRKTQNWIFHFLLKPLVTAVPGAAFFNLTNKSDTFPLLLSATGSLSAVMCASLLYYIYLDPLEKKARNTAQLFAQDPRWSKIITVTGRDRMNNYPLPADSPERL